MKEILLYSGSSIIVVWGVAHIAIPTKGIIGSFGPISADSKRILLMEWVMEGLALSFIGLLVIFITAFGEIENPTSVIVLRGSAIMLVTMAVVSLFTGARTRLIPMKLCPPIFVSVAIIYLAGSIW